MRKKHANVIFSLPGVQTMITFDEPPWTPKKTGLKDMVNEQYNTDNEK